MNPSSEKRNPIIAFLHSWNGALLCVFLVAIARFRDSGTLGPHGANGLSVLLIGLGVGMALWGRDKLRRLAELFLWLGFILTLSLYKELAEALAAWLDTTWIQVFRPLAVVHGVLTLISLWVLGAWSPAGGPKGQGLIKMSAGLLIFGAAVFWTGARTFPGSSLEAVAGNLDGHLWTAANFLAATVITLVGLLLLRFELQNRGASLASALGLFSFSFGAVFWVLHLALRLTLIPQAAAAFSRTGAAPPWFDPWSDWIGLLFGIFSVLAYLGIIAFGVAWLNASVQPRWVGKACVGFGLLALPWLGRPFLFMPFFGSWGWWCCARKRPVTRIFRPLKAWVCGTQKLTIT